MGLGLDRLVMLRKGVDDVRLLRSADPRVAGQMLDLSPYRPVSAMPPVRRDLSVAVDASQDAELLGDRVRSALGPDAASVEEVAVLGETSYDELPTTARERMGVRPGQKNVLVRVVLRDLDRTLTTGEANALRDRIYAELHEGAAHEWAASLTAHRDGSARLSGDPAASE
jgi:phenylalanyl-tRNA synthetase alpha chain